MEFVKQVSKKIFKSAPSGKKSKNNYYIQVKNYKKRIFRENILPKPCSVQAARPPSPEAEEVDELSEYFTHFVRVELKMSSLAESMYV